MMRIFRNTQVLFVHNHVYELILALIISVVGVFIIATRMTLNREGLPKNKKDLEHKAKNDFEQKYTNH